MLHILEVRGRSRQENIRYGQKNIQAGDLPVRVFFKDDLYHV